MDVSTHVRDGSRKTARRNHLRGRARCHKVVAALNLFVELANLSMSDSHWQARCDTPRSRNVRRDVFPLPLDSGCCLDGFEVCLPPWGVEVLRRLVDSSCLALNILHGQGRSAPTGFVPNRAQRSSLNSIASRWLQLGRHMAKIPQELNESPFEAFEALVEKGSGGRAVPLQAALVDCLDDCAQVNPCAFLTAPEKEVLKNQGAFFEDGRAGGLEASGRFKGGARREYVMLVRAFCRAGKLCLQRECRHSASVFAVSKPSSGTQRVVWDGGDLSRAAVRPPMPPLLSSPCDLPILECSDDAPLVASVRDGQCFLDQLRMPEWMRQYVGYPQVTCGELCAKDIGDASDQQLGALSWAELLALLPVDQRGLLTSASLLFPASVSWPMGASWASFIAQRTMVSLAQEAGVPPESFLHSGNGLPPAEGPAVSVATDDVICFERQLDPTVVEGSTSPVFQSLDETWKKHNVKPKISKRIERASDCDALGLSLVCGRFLLPKRSRLTRIVLAITHLLSTRRAAPQAMGRFFGVVQWTLLLNRPLLSVCGALYQFIDHTDRNVLPLPRKVLDELSLLSRLLFALAVDLRSGWAPFILASDGAENFGYGASIARCSPQTSRACASHARSWPHMFVPRDATTSNDSGDPNIMRLPSPSKSFRTLFSIRSSSGFHASKLEIGALCLAVRHVARHPRWHRCRAFCLIDAQALLHTVRKGRSSSKNFWYGSRALAALQLSCGIQLSVGYVPSQFNPSDAASRGQDGARRARVRKGSHAEKLSKLDEMESRARRALRRLKSCGMIDSDTYDPSWSSIDSASTLAQPST